MMSLWLKRWGWPIRSPLMDRGILSLASQSIRAMVFGRSRRLMGIRRLLMGWPFGLWFLAGVGGLFAAI